MSELRDIEIQSDRMRFRRNLERIADRSTNVAERTVYAVTGMMAQLDISSY